MCAKRVKDFMNCFISAWSGARHRIDVEAGSGPLRRGRTSEGREKIGLGEQFSNRIGGVCGLVWVIRNIRERKRHRRDQDATRTQTRIRMLAGGVELVMVKRERQKGKMSLEESTRKTSVHNSGRRESTHPIDLGPKEKTIHEEKGRARRSDYRTMDHGTVSWSKSIPLIDLEGRNPEELKRSDYRNEKRPDERRCRSGTQTH